MPDVWPLYSVTASRKKKRIDWTEARLTTTPRVISMCVAWFTITTWRLDATIEHIGLSFFQAFALDWQVSVLCYGASNLDVTFEYHNSITLQGTEKKNPINCKHGSRAVRKGISLRFFCFTVHVYRNLSYTNDRSRIDSWALQIIITNNWVEIDDEQGLGQSLPDLPGRPPAFSIIPTDWSLEQVILTCDHSGSIWFLNMHRENKPLINTGPSSDLTQRSRLMVLNNKRIFTASLWTRLEGCQFFARQRLEVNKIGSSATRPQEI